MESDLTVNRTNTVYDIHPCYELDNTVYVFTSNPSIICVLVCIFLVLSSVVTTCGNLLVIISIIYFNQLHDPTNYLILSLAVTDLLVGVVVFPLSVAFSATMCWYQESFICNIRFSFHASLCTCSILHLCFISIDRYYAVCQPLTYRIKITVHVTVIMILVSWSISALVGIGMAVLKLSREPCEETCLVELLVNTFAIVFSFYLPAVIMLCIYLKIFFVAQKQVNSIQNTTCQSTKSGAAVSKTERKATKTLAIVMGVFLLCMIPNFLYVAFLSSLHEPPPDAVYEALHLLTLSNSMLNPFIYAFFYSWFRSAFKMIINGKIFQGDFTNYRLC